MNHKARYLMHSLSCLGLSAFLAGAAVAQPPEGKPRGDREGRPGFGRPEGGPGGREGGMRGDPETIAKMMLQRFDKDGDQKLDREELLAAIGAMRMMGIPGGPSGPGGPLGPGGPGAGPFGGGMPGGGPGGAGPGGAGMMARMFEQNDKDGDGKLTGDEIPERMRQGMARIDTNGDGAIDKSEMEQMMRAFAGGNRPGRGDGPRGDGAEEGNKTPRRPPTEE